MARWPQASVEAAPPAWDKAMQVRRGLHSRNKFTQLIIVITLRYTFSSKLRHLPLWGRAMKKDSYNAVSYAARPRRQDYPIEVD